MPLPIRVPQVAGDQLGLTSGIPNVSTLGRLPARLDSDALDDAVGAWLARYAADPVDEPGGTLVSAWRSLSGNRASIRPGAVQTDPPTAAS
ncbi:hypothetical protein GCM10010251_18690 [Streptomyces aurantiogriseus]|uniref:Uncharacterized protein n=1 Tax=Streptomyces aurantiogriseus TaxID=66870 RepID=A0A918F369_9ACTN|nr:hypothetical protein GCM10010251_18690 [Streptomyces aurantiogriseus]